MGDSRPIGEGTSGIRPVSGMRPVGGSDAKPSLSPPITDGKGPHGCHGNGGRCVAYKMKDGELCSGHQRSTDADKD